MSLLVRLQTLPRLMITLLGLHRADTPQLIKTLTEQLEGKKKELAEFQAKYKIKVNNEGSQQQQKAGQSSGVLVKEK